MTETKRISASDLYAALAKRYAAPRYALLSQVGSGTGWARGRWADALAMGLWPSRGLYLHGFEIKVHRNDWLRELKNPAKAEEIAGYCHFWWVVATPDAVKEDELPEDWGLLTYTGRTLLQAKAARERKPAELDHFIVAAILRRATEHMTPKTAVDGLIEDAREEGRQQARREHEHEVGDAALRREIEETRAAISEFEKQSGIRIERWSAGKIGSHVKAARAIADLRGWPWNDAERQLERLVAGLRTAREQFEASIRETRDGVAPANGARS